MEAVEFRCFGCVFIGLLITGYSTVKVPLNVTHPAEINGTASGTLFVG